MKSKPKKYEIMIRSYHWVEVSKRIFNAWTGQRRIDDVPYVGPVYNLDGTYE